jgi:tetratricopeptide (TPR) repeat protein/tRNA A-37 threonylcarbamoyl transferase component Bud32
MSDAQFLGIEGLPEEAAARVKKVCLRFEDAWQARPLLAGYLGEAAGLEREVLFSELLRRDLHYRRMAGARPTAEDYRALFPEYAGRIDAALAAPARPGPVVAEGQAGLSNGAASGPPSARTASDRNLLFGILALQMEFINRDVLIAALHAWVLAKHKSLGQILQEQGALGEDEPALLEALVQQHLRRHGHDPKQSLAALSTLKVVREELAGITDEDVQASVEKSTRPPDADPNATVCEPPSAGAGAAGLRYRILRAHDEGGLGKVSVAQDEELHREVAFKEIRERYADDPHLRRRFVQEGEITGALEHPGIVPVYGLGRHADGRPYYAMRFIRGESLKQAVERFHKADVPGRDPGERNLALRQLLSQFVVVCKTMAFAHDRGIIHRDLKPANIMLGKYGETLVVDWGLAKAVGRPESARDGTEVTVQPSPDAGVEPTARNVVIGSPPYMSPEQAAGRGEEVGLASDIFGLGATLYAVLTGQAPYSGEDRVKVLEKAYAGAFPAPRQVKQGVAPGLEAICLKAMAFEPGGRYPQALDLADDVEKWLADEPFPAYREPWTGRTRRFLRRRRTLVTGVVAPLLAVLFLSGGIWWWLKQARAETARVTEIALNRAVELGKEKKWAEALVEARRAEALLERGGWDEELGRRVRELLKDLKMVERLEESRQSRLLIAKEGDRLRIAEVIDRDYAAAFRGYGIDVMGLTPEEAGDRIRECFVKEEIAATLDDWADLRRNIPPGRARGWRRLIKIARLGDPDPWRNRFRSALLRPQTQTLKQLVVKARTKRLPPSTLVLIGMILRREGNIPGAIRLLRKAQQQYPGDIWVNHSLAIDLVKKNPPEFQEAIRFFTAGVALRSQSPSLYVDLGFALYQEGRQKEAIAAFRRAIALNPKFAQAHTNLGVALYRQGKLAEAVTEHRRAIASDPKHANAHYNLGLVLAAQGKLAKAVGEFRRAIELDPKHALAHLDFGIALKVQGKVAEAVTEFHQAIAHDPKLARAHYNLAIALKEQGKRAEAVREFRRAIDNEPRYALAHYNLGIALVKQGKLAEAVREFRRVIDSEPRYAPAHYNLGIALRAQGKVAEAVTAYRRAIALDPKHAEAHTNLGAALYYQGKRAEGVREYRRAIALDPKLAPAHTNFGVALNDQGKRAEAVREYRRAIALDPKSADPHNNLGNALYAQGKPSEAVREYRRAIALDPKDASFHYNLGLVLGEQGQGGKAVKELRRAIALDPKLAPAHLDLGIALRAQRKVAEAVTAYRRAIALDPKLARPHYNLAIALQEQGNLAEAVPEFRRAIDNDPRYAPAHYNLGIALVKQGQRAEAVREFRRAIALDPKDAKAHVGLGVALAAQGHQAEAMREIRRAIALDPKDAKAHGALGQALLQLGRFAEARRANRACLRLLPSGHPLRPLAAQQLRQCQQLLTLDRKVTAILKGEGKPDGPAEQLKLAYLCLRYKKRFVAAAQFFAAAFTAYPELADDPKASHRYKAACAAALASCGQGENAGTLTLQQRAFWRKQSLAWLRDDLAALTKYLANNTPKVRAQVRQVLQYWKNDSALAGVRIEEDLVWLKYEERKAWRQFWFDVAALLKKAAEPR